MNFCEDQVSFTASNKVHNLSQIYPKWISPEIQGNQEAPETPPVLRLSLAGINPPGDDQNKKKRIGRKYGLRRGLFPIIRSPKTKIDTK